MQGDKHKLIWIKEIHSDSSIETPYRACRTDTEGGPPRCFQGRLHDLVSASRQLQMTLPGLLPGGNAKWAGRGGRWGGRWRRTRGRLLNVSFMSTFVYLGQTNTSYVLTVGLNVKSFILWCLVFFWTIKKCHWHRTKLMPLVYKGQEMDLCGCVWVYVFVWHWKHCWSRLAILAVLLSSSAPSPVQYCSHSCHFHSAPGFSGKEKQK